MDAVVMGAGEGQRMRPLTERWPKPVLPIDGRPVLSTLLRELASAGLTRVSVVRQPRPDGSADTVVRALAAGARTPLLVTGADTLFAPGDIGRFRARFEGSQAAGAVAVRREPPPSPPHRFAVRIRDGRVQRLLDDDPVNPLAGAPLWVIGEQLVPLLEGLPGPPFELADVLQRGVDRGEEVLGFEIGPTRDLTNPLDLVKENFPYLR